jgi:hypothetical protein
LFVIYQREAESDQIESEEEETVQEKKLRLAKHLIDQIEKRMKNFILTLLTKNKMIINLNKRKTKRIE